MKRGVPPTALKARTGEFTPPGMVVFARSKSACDRFMSNLLLVRMWTGIIAGLPVNKKADLEGPQVDHHDNDKQRKHRYLVEDPVEDVGLVVLATIDSGHVDAALDVIGHEEHHQQ